MIIFHLTMDASLLLQELSFRTSKSGGPGGQHVNKTETKVALMWDPGNSLALNKTEAQTLLHNLAGRIRKDGRLHMSCWKHRSQLQNKEEVTKRFLLLVKESIRPKKKRKATKPSRTSREARLKEKRLQGQKKRERRGGWE